MKILLIDNFSILEYLYRKSLGEEVKLVMDISEADAVVCSEYTPLFYNKTAIIVSEKLPNKEVIKNISSVNEVISRVPIEYLSDEEYTLNPYSLKEIKNLKFKSFRNKPISILALRDYSFTKRNEDYYIESSSAYLGTKYKNCPTLIGLLKHQLEVKKGQK